MESPWETLKARLPASREAAALLRGLEQGRFPELQEAEFRAGYNESGWNRIRFGMGTGLALFVLYAIWDCFTFPPEMLRWSLPLRLGVTAPLFAAVLVIGRDRERRRRIDLWVRPALLAAGGTVVTVVLLARLHDFPRAAEGLILVTLAAYSLTGLRVRQAVPLAGCFLVADVVGPLLLGVPAGVVLSDAAFLATANLIGFVDCASRERSARSEFVMIRLLNEAADHDGLTGLANRRTLDRRIDELVRQHSRDRAPLCLALLDVDHFKLYNDRYGHPAGDEVLRRVAAALSELTRRPLDVAARYGGEEFAVVWHAPSREGAEELASGIHAAVAGLRIPHETSPTSDRVSVSVGLVWAGDPRDGRDELLLAADAALYQAKADGRSRSVVVELDAARSGVSPTSASPADSGLRSVVGA